MTGHTPLRLGRQGRALTATATVLTLAAAITTNPITGTVAWLTWCATSALLVSHFRQDRKQPR